MSTLSASFVEGSAPSCLEISERQSRDRAESTPAPGNCSHTAAPWLRDLQRVPPQARRHAAFVGVSAQRLSDHEMSRFTMPRIDAELLKQFGLVTETSLAVTMRDALRVEWVSDCALGGEGPDPDRGSYLPQAPEDSTVQGVPESLEFSVPELPEPALAALPICTEIIPSCVDCIGCDSTSVENVLGKVQCEKR